MELSDSCRDAAMYSSTVGGRSCMKQGMLKVSSAILSTFGGETADLVGSHLCDSGIQVPAGDGIGAVSEAF